ncbi:hypothetical protein [Gordonia sp. N1V]|uniref:hypothetical protein n=1 Tax=Gordonia sp. N1V TaxID=3034163 RepID=UPI0023E30320|nr:hypothetical protein [Gordonia sp. N1V]MDF3280890.1 hypothetical protein [Gordonia sp. N1V]
MPDHDHTPDRVLDWRRVTPEFDRVEHRGFWVQMPRVGNNRQHISRRAMRCAPTGAVRRNGSRMMSLTLSMREMSEWLRHEYKRGQRDGWQAAEIASKLREV